MQRTSNKKFTRKKYCFFCKETKTLGAEVGPAYKNITLLRKFITERGKIVPKNRSGLCSQHQKKLATQVKIARQLALLTNSTNI